MTTHASARLAICVLISFRAGGVPVNAQGRRGGTPNQEPTTTPAAQQPQ
ncbi:MAG: hypothetical protein ACJ746_06035 [Bryobacteraceae bacterium]